MSYAYNKFNSSQIVATEFSQAIWPDDFRLQGGYADTNHDAIFTINNRNF
jgi:hypothetical protein